MLVTQDATSIANILAANLNGTIFCTQIALQSMLRQRAGVIINISSTSAERPNSGLSVYGDAKGGIESFTKAVALEYAPKGIRALCVRPGPFETDMLKSSMQLAADEIVAKSPMGRIGSPEELAEFVVFLLGDKATYLTGSIHTVDGGYLIG